MIFCIGVTAGDNPVMVFYVAHWDMYVTGTMLFNMYDAMEGVLTIAFFSLVSAIFGPALWSVKVVIIQMKYMAVLSSLCVVGFNTCMYLTNIYRYVPENGQTENLTTRKLFPLLPLSTVLLPPLLMYHMSPTMILRDRVVIFCLGCACEHVREGPGNLGHDIVRANRRFADLLLQDTRSRLVVFVFLADILCG